MTPEQFTAMWIAATAIMVIFSAAAIARILFLSSLLERCMRLIEEQNETLQTVLEERDYWRNAALSKN